MKMKAIVANALVVALCVSICTSVVEAKESLSHEGYRLEQVVVLSRHNIRAPLSGGDSLLGRVTPYEWNQWSSGASELSLKGGVLETEMGQYFRKWLVSEGLISENFHPADGQVRIYSNSKQRTIATAQYFTSGMMPTANVRIEYHMDYDKMDPVFTPQLTFCTPQYQADVTAQINALYGPEMASLQDNYDFISNVIAMDKSTAWKSGEVKKLVTGDNVYDLKTGDEPRIKGSASTAVSISDALVLQYYEEDNAKKAGFGKNISTKKWKEVSEIKDTIGDAMFTAPLVASNVAYPLVKELNTEMNQDGRVFTFLCGHDSNIGSVLADLGVKDYDLPNSVESKTPIGSKVVFSKWTNQAGQQFWSVDLVYQSTEQLRETSMLDLEHSPEVYHLQFDGIQQNSDGLYTEEDLESIFQRAMNNYQLLYNYYCQ